MNLVLGRKYHCPPEFVLGIFPNFTHEQILAAHYIFYNSLDFWRCCKFRGSGHLVSMPAQGWQHILSYSPAPVPEELSDLEWQVGLQIIGYLSSRMWDSCLLEAFIISTWKTSTKNHFQGHLHLTVFKCQVCVSFYILINSEASRTLHSRLWSLDQKT